MTVDDAIALAEQILQPEGLNDLQETVFRYCWDGLSYQDIADEIGYDPGYIRTVGSHLWKQLSDYLGKKITKSNLQTAFRQYNYILEAGKSLPLPEPISLTPEFPGLPLNSESPFYIYRPTIEQRCLQEIVKPGALIRIQAPKQMGKTSLLYRLLDYAQNKGYQTLRLSCQEAAVDSFTDLNTFLRWLCNSIARKLAHPGKIHEFWEEEPSLVKASCTAYFQDYLLQEDVPLVLGLDDVERVFLYQQIAQDFFPLLRVWHEEANEIEIWQNLRLIVIHSTEVYVPLDIHQSPFNVGLPIYLPDWGIEQVQELALRYGLDWIQEDAFHALLATVGGHPYLVQLALYYLWEGNLSIEEILRDAATDAGIYGSHLRRLLEILNSSPELCSAMKKVVKSDQPVEVPPIVAYKLQSMGLVKLVGNWVTIRYKIYHDYLRSRLN